MGVIGGNGGYASIAPIQGNPIGDAMQSVENMDIKRRNERLSQAKLQQEADQANQARLDKRNSMMQSFTDKHPGAKDIGIQQPDAILHQGVEEGRQQYIDAQSILSNPNSTPSQRSEAYATSQNVSNSFDQMADFSKKLTEVMDAARENKGGVFNPNGVKESLNNNEKFKSGQWKLNRAKNGTINVDTFDVDTDGKFTVPTGVGLSPQELLQKYTPPLNYSNENNDAEFKKALPLLSEWESKDGKQVYKGYQGIEQYAKDNAESVVTNRDKMYGIAAAAGVAPQMDLKDYHPEEIKKIKDFIINGFTEKYKAVPLPNYKKLELDNKTNEQNYQHGQDKINTNLKKQEIASKVANTGTTIAPSITQYNNTLPGSNYRIPKGSGKLTINSKGAKDISGAVRDLQEVYVTPKGTVVYGIREKNVDKSKLTPEAEKEKKDSPSTFDPKNENNYVVSERVKYYDSTNKSDKVAPAILNTINPETGKNFINTRESDAWAKKNTHPNIGKAKVEVDEYGVPKNK